MALNRRQAIKHFWMLLASSPLLQAQRPADKKRPSYQPDRIPPVEELVNALEYEDVARKMLPEPIYDHILRGVINLSEGSGRARPDPGVSIVQTPDQAGTDRGDFGTQIESGRDGGLTQTGRVAVQSGDQQRDELVRHDSDRAQGEERG